MLKISSLPLYRLKKSTHFELMNRFYGVLNDYETSHEKFLRAKAALLDAIHKEEEKLMQFKSSTWTQVMAEHRDTMNPNRSLDYYAQTNFLFVICLSVFRLQWNPIAPSKRRDI